MKKRNKNIKEEREYKEYGFRELLHGFVIGLIAGFILAIVML